MRIPRKHRRGSSQAFVYSWPSKTALASIMAKIKAITRQRTDQPLSDLLRQINAALRGWTVYFRHGCSKQTFGYLGYYTWLRVVEWLRRKHRRASWESLRRRYLATPVGLVPHDGAIALFNPGSVPVTRYRYRGTKIPNPWTEWTTTTRTTG
jgi:RNA-directed DNA polymerase